ncbi:MAG TPA: hypothetical protein VGP64_06550 [Polyangia bacterium]
MAGLAACSSPLPSQVCATSLTYTTTYTTAVKRELDLVFVIDDSAAMAGWQAQLASQLPLLGALGACEECPSPRDVHIGVVSSDLGVGAALNAAIPGCSGQGDGGQFRYQPEGMCTDTTLDPGATFISNTGDDWNFSTPGDAAGSGVGKVFECIAQLGDGGCGFGQPLAALDRALGADGQPPPAANAGFLRPDATLGIVFISSEDDCSVRADSTLFSASSATGPLTHYRCNQAGHVCQAPNGDSIAPFIAPPPGVMTADGVPTVSLENCQSNEAGELTPVSKFVADIKALKPDPDNQILVSAIVGPPSPYAVEWVASAASGGAAWPRVAPSCGTEDADGNGAFGEPGVRLTQFATSFPDSVVSSICDPSYTEAFVALDESVASDFGPPPCLPANIETRTDSAGNTYPDCVVTEHLTVAGSAQDISIPPCLGPPGDTACWQLAPGAQGCSGPGQQVIVQNEPVGPDPAQYSASIRVSCQLPPPGDGGACPD